jgi:hypothetical protein
MANLRIGVRSMRILELREAIERKVAPCRSILVKRAGAFGKMGKRDANPMQFAQL